MNSKIEIFIEKLDTKATKKGPIIPKLDSFYTKLVNNLKFKFNAETVNGLVEQLKCLSQLDKKTEHKDIFYYFICDLLFKIIKKIKFKYLFNIWQDVLSTVIETMYSRSFNCCLSAISLIEHILIRLKNEQCPDPYLKYISNLFAKLTLILDDLCNCIDEDIQECWDELGGTRILGDFVQTAIRTFGSKISKENYLNIIDFSCKVYQYTIGPRYIANMGMSIITQTFNLIFIENEIPIKMPQSVLAIFRDVFKSYKLYENDSTVINDCLDFFSLMCKHDIAFVYALRSEIFDYLNRMQDKIVLANENRHIDDDDDDVEFKSELYDLKRTGLNLIQNLIKYWSFEIYILLDRKGINEFIDACKQNEGPDDIVYLANAISNQIYNYKASLRKFFVFNGYPKILT